MKNFELQLKIKLPESFSELSEDDLWWEFYNNLIGYAQRKHTRDCIESNNSEEIERHSAWVDYIKLSEFKIKKKEDVQLKLF